MLTGDLCQPEVVAGGNGAGEAGQGSWGPGLIPGAAHRVLSPGWGAALGEDRVLSWHWDAQPPGKGLGSLTFTQSPPASHPQGRRASARSQDPGVSLWMWTRIHPGLDYAHEHSASQPQNPGDTPTPAASRAQVPALGCVGSASTPRSGMGCRGTPSPGGPRPLGYLRCYSIAPCCGWVTCVPPSQCHRGAVGTDPGLRGHVQGTHLGGCGNTVRSSGLHCGARETPGLWGYAGGPQGRALGPWGWALEPPCPGSGRHGGTSGRD